LFCDHFHDFFLAAFPPGVVPDFMVVIMVKRGVGREEFLEGVLAEV